LNPCFDDVRLRVSADVLLEGTREQAERRGLLCMAPDVITFVITIPVYGQCLETIKFAISYAFFRDHTGGQRRITSKETDRKKAQRLAGEYDYLVGLMI
jgi:hypothetical protein